MTIIAFSGKAGTGKDTAGDILSNKYGFTKIAFADPLRNLCARVFYLDPAMFLDRDKKDSPMKRIYLDFHDLDAIRTIVETEWGFEISEEAREQMEEFHGIYFDTPRDIMRFVGTKIVRNCIGDDIWIKLAAEKMKSLGGKIVITDCRFESERDFLRKIGAIMCLVKRNDNGQTTEHEFDLGSDDEYDVIFNNDGSLYSYQSSIDLWYNTKKNEFELYRVWKYE